MLTWPSALELHLWWLNTGDFDGTVLSRLESLLSDIERQRAARFQYREDRQRYVASNGALRVLLGTYLRTDPRLVPIVSGPCVRCHGSHGKPLVLTHPRLNFSMSHSGRVAVFALSRHAVGVDVESVDALPDYTVMNGYFTPMEWQALLRLPVEGRSQAAVGCWVRKEAYLKGTGDGVIGNLAGIHVGLGDGEVGDQSLLPMNWTLTDLPAPSGYAASAAVASSDGVQVVSRPVILDDSWWSAA
jgi:4'-phosphopantetheinyl transferase